MQCQFDSHVSSEVARFNSGQFRHRQRQSFRIFKNSPDRLYEIGDLVLVQSRRPTFHKNDPVFYPNYEKNFFKITYIDKKFLPWKYHLKEQGEPNRTKQLYGFEIKKFGSPSDPSSHSTSVTAETPHRVRVLDVIHRDQTRLRSGKTFGNNSLLFYRVLINDKEDILPAESLHVLKNSLGADALAYGPYFALPENISYVI